MLDLQARIDFEEIEFVGGGVVNKFDGARAVVVHRAAESQRGLPKCGARLLGQIRCGRFLDDFLIAALRGAIALAERNDVAFAVAEDLHFDMPRARHISR